MERATIDRRHARRTPRTPHSPTTPERPMYSSEWFGKGTTFHTLDPSGIEPGEVDNFTLPEGIEVQFLAQTNRPGTYLRGNILQMRVNLEPETTLITQDQLDGVPKLIPHRRSIIVHERIIDNIDIWPNRVFYLAREVFEKSDS